MVKAAAKTEAKAAEKRENKGKSGGESGSESGDEGGVESLPCWPSETAADLPNWATRAKRVSIENDAVMDGYMGMAAPTPPATSVAADEGED